MNEISLKILNATEKRDKLKEELKEIEIYIAKLKKQLEGE